MRLGKDFWKVLDVLRWVVAIIEHVAKFINSDTPDGQEKDPTE